MSQRGPERASRMSVAAAAALAFATGCAGNAGKFDESKAWQGPGHQYIKGTRLEVSGEAGTSRLGKSRFGLSKADAAVLFEVVDDTRGKVLVGPTARMRTDAGSHPDDLKDGMVGGTVRAALGHENGISEHLAGEIQGTLGAGIQNFRGSDVHGTARADAKASFRLGNALGYDFGPQVGGSVESRFAQEAIGSDALVKIGMKMVGKGEGDMVTAAELSGVAVFETAKSPEKRNRGDIATRLKAFGAELLVQIGNLFFSVKATADSGVVSADSPTGTAIDRDRRDGATFSAGVGGKF